MKFKLTEFNLSILEKELNRIYKNSSRNYVYSGYSFLINKATNKLQLDLYLDPIKEKDKRGNFFKKRVRTLHYSDEELKNLGAKF